MQYCKIDTFYTIIRPHVMEHYNEKTNFLKNYRDIIKFKTML